MKKLLAVLLALGMVLSFAGCGGDGGKNTEKKAEASIVGGWDGEMPVGNLLRESITEALGVDAEDSTQKALAEKITALDFDTLTMTMHLQFDETTMTMSVDKSEAEALGSAIAEMMRAPIEEVLTDMLKEQNLDMSLDELLAMQDTSLDAMLDEMIASMDYDEMVIDESSTYRLEGNTLYLDDETDEYFVVELTDDTLSLSDIVMQDADEEDAVFIEMLKAIEFKKVK